MFFKEFHKITANEPIIRYKLIAATGAFDALSLLFTLSYCWIVHKVFIIHCEIRILVEQIVDINALLFPINSMNADFYLLSSIHPEATIMINVPKLYHPMNSIFIPPEAWVNDNDFTFGFLRINIEFA